MHVGLEVVVGERKATKCSACGLSSQTNVGLLALELEEPRARCCWVRHGNSISWIGLDQMI